MSDTPAPTHLSPEAAGTEVAGFDSHAATRAPPEAAGVERPLTKKYPLGVVIPYLALRSANAWLCAAKEHLRAFEMQVAELKQELAEQEVEKLALVRENKELALRLDIARTAMEVGHRPDPWAPRPPAPPQPEAREQQGAPFGERTA